MKRKTEREKRERAAAMRAAGRELEMTHYQRWALQDKRAAKHQAAPERRGK